jgi:hypothetical protein
MAAVVAVLAVGCGGDKSTDSNGGGGGGGGGEGVSEAFLICGPNEVWWEGEDSGGDGMAFRSNGRAEWLDICDYSMNYSRWTTKGEIGWSWSLNGNQLTMDYGDGTHNTGTVERLSNDTIRLIFGNESSTLTKRTDVTIVDSCD